MNQPRELKRVVVKEELFVLTGDIFKAIILNQFIYWSQRVRDFDKFLAEENERMNQEGNTANVAPSNGWIYKSAEELIEETMLGISEATIGRHIKRLVEDGYLICRQNPDHKWDRTKQYRVDFVKVQHDLFELGFSLDGYALLSSEHAFFKMKNASFKMNDAENAHSDANFILKDGDFKMKNGDFNLKGRSSQIERAIPEITSNLDVDDIDDPSAPFEYPTNTTQNEIATTSELDGTDSPSAQQPNDDPYTQVNLRMRSHTKNPQYRPKEGDYSCLNKLLKSQVPLDFILRGIDFTFSIDSSKTIQSFAYCAKIIAQQWALELEKQADVEPIDFKVQKQQQRETILKKEAKQVNSQRDERYSNFYELFPGS